MMKQELSPEDVLRKMETLIYTINNIDDYEARVLLDILSESCEELREVSLSLAECHVIDCIGKAEPINTTAIAQKLNMTKGGISKITAKLMKKDMIAVQRLAANKKETYYLLRPLGTKVFQVHETLHDKAAARFMMMLGQYTAEEVSFAGRLLDDLTTTFRTTVEISGDNNER